MSRRKWAAAAACAAAAFALAAGIGCMPVRQARTPPPPDAPVAAGRQSAAGSSFTLFPELNDMHITALTIATPERSFQFHLDRQGVVSVNGQQADTEVFSTLLEQIVELPVERHSAFAPDKHDLILTLVVSTGAQQQTARFYEDEGTQETARIVLGTEESPEYRQTGIWRVGTLMMTCEGTRILDAHGNETPVRQ